MSGWGQATAQVVRVRRARFVEFVFTVDGDLAIELVLPYKEFRLFCDDHDVEILPADAAIEAELSDLLAREADRVHFDQAGSR
ncbi:MAG TPA: phenol hydroxylase subunit [Ilumatobacteraceae bacterium]|nr:phenol hydroxylase subunit [Ilumatobacteraceae bacterium]